jgi:hypothetical protein
LACISGSAFTYDGAGATGTERATDGVYRVIEGGGQAAAGSCGTSAMQAGGAQGELLQPATTRARAPTAATANGRATFMGVPFVSFRAQFAG